MNSKAYYLRVTRIKTKCKVVGSKIQKVMRVFSFQSTIFGTKLSCEIFYVQVICWQVQVIQVITYVQVICMIFILKTNRSNLRCIGNFADSLHKFCSCSIENFSFGDFKIE